MIFTGIADEAGPLLGTQIRAHQALGWSHLELRMVQVPGMETPLNAASADLADRHFEMVCQMLKEVKLDVSAFSSKIGDWSRPITGDFQIDVTNLMAAIPRMKYLGVKYIRVMSYPNDPKEPWPEEAWRDEAIRRMRELVAIAEKYNIVLAHENCSGYGGTSPERNVILLDAIQSPNFGVLFDTGNPPTYGYDSWEWYKQVAGRIVYVHIKDAKKVDGKDIYTLPGEGDGCVCQVLSDLNERDYRGFVSIEPHLAAVIHTGQQVANAKQAFDSYVKYGDRLAGMTI